MDKIDDKKLELELTLRFKELELKTNAETSIKIAKINAEKEASVEIAKINAETSIKIAKINAEKEASIEIEIKKLEGSTIFYYLYLSY
jgi:hypothetical protein